MQAIQKDILLKGKINKNRVILTSLTKANEYTYEVLDTPYKRSQSYGYNVEFVSAKPEYDKRGKLIKQGGSTQFKTTTKSVTVSYLESDFDALLLDLGLTKGKGDTALGLLDTNGYTVVDDK